MNIFTLTVSYSSTQPRTAGPVFLRLTSSLILVKLVEQDLPDSVVHLDQHLRPRHRFLYIPEGREHIRSAILRSQQEQELYRNKAHLEHDDALLPPLPQHAEKPNDRPPPQPFVDAHVDDLVDRNHGLGRGGREEEPSVSCREEETEEGKGGDGF